MTEDFNLKEDDLLLAMELEMGLAEALEEHKRGELIDPDDLAIKYGLNPAEFEASEKPEGYDEMIPKRYRNRRWNSN